MRGQRQYLVKWKGYTDEHNTWEPKKNLEGALRLLREFQEGVTRAAQKVLRTGQEAEFPKEQLLEHSSTSLLLQGHSTTGVDYSLLDPDFLRKYFSPV